MLAADVDVGVVKFSMTVFGFTVNAEADLAENEIERVVVTRAKERNATNADLTLWDRWKLLTISPVECATDYIPSLIVN